MSDLLNLKDDRFFFIKVNYSSELSTLIEEAFYGENTYTTRFRGIQLSHNILLNLNHNAKSKDRVDATWRSALKFDMVFPLRQPIWKAEA